LRAFVGVLTYTASASLRGNRAMLINRSSDKLHQVILGK